MSARILLHALTTQGEFLCGEVYDVEGVHHCPCLVEGFGGGGAVAGEPVHRDHPDTVAERRITRVEPVLQRGFGAPGDHIQQPGRTGTVHDWGQVDQYRHETRITLAANMFPLVFIHA